MEYLREQLEELVDNEEKALVFSQYPGKTLREIEPDLEDFEPQMFHGQLSDRQRDRVVREFQEQDESKVLLMSVRAGGVGLTLTRANHVFHFDLWWNPAVARQAEGRAHRIGQQKPVFVKTLYTVGTIEERIHNLLAEKEALFQQVIDDLSDTSLTNLLTEEDLFGLFDLESPHPSKEKNRSQKLSDALQNLSPLQFEELIARLYERQGFIARQTQASYDQGVDIHAKRTTDAGTDSLVIQCKHYYNGTVPVSAVRDLYGVLRSRPQVGRAVLVTSGHFSKPCYDFAGGKNIQLLPMEELVGLLEKYDLLDDLA
jgi:HJR/Mrr/RecB family endonuclease